MLVTRALRARTRRSKLWAVRDVTFNVADGECVGIIGRNGSGKSTLLRMLAGITGPTEGLIAVRGRIAPMISVGVGFHAELTGRENVYVNGMILGVSRRELDRRFDEIVDFAEIPDFIDTPVKFYSSGMFVRLGFGVALLAEPDILLVDEVLAVGDLAFQMKCFDRMTEIRKTGTTVVVVSHNLNAVRNMCQRTIVIHDGRVRHDGDTEEAISLFHQLLGEDRDLDGHRMPGHGHVLDEAAVIEGYEICDATGAPTRFIETGGEALFRMNVRFLRDVESPVFGIQIVNEAGVAVYTGSTNWAGSGHHAAGSTATVEARMRLPLTTGSYTAQLGASSAYNAETIAVPPRPILFYISGSVAHGVVDLAAEFKIDGKAGLDDRSVSLPEVDGTSLHGGEDCNDGGHRA